MQTCKHVIPSFSIWATEGHLPTLHNEDSLGLQGRHYWFDGTSSAKWAVVTLDSRLAPHFCSIEHWILHTSCTRSIQYHMMDLELQKIPAQAPLSGCISCTQVCYVSCVASPWRSVPSWVLINAGYVSWMSPKVMPRSFLDIPIYPNQR